MSHQFASRIELLGLPVDILSMEDTIEACNQIIVNGVPAQHVVVNAAKIVMAHSNHRLRDVIRRCPIVNADGQSVVWAAALHGFRLPERVAGIDLMDELWQLAITRGYSVYLLGADEDVVTAVGDKARERGINVAGLHNGFWNEKEEEYVIQDVAASNAHILFVALPSPRKELFLFENLSKLNVPLAVGVGGSFDVIAGRQARAPLWMQKYGLEWFYRLIQEPRRLTRRYAVGNTIFVLLVVRSLCQRVLAVSARDGS